MKLPRRKSRPHPRFKRACDGTGRMPWDIYSSKPPPRGSEAWDRINAAMEGKSETGRFCPVCWETDIPLRKHKSRDHPEWKVGSLVMHTGVKLTWWERFMGFAVR